ncbi:hypothetical protein HDZ31DRAFT_71456 [Schizophyllum fasciatum]
MVPAFFSHVIVLFVLLQIALLVQAQDVDALRQAFEEADIAAVFPDDSAYANASMPYNLRYTVRPVAITYPSTPEQVSVVVSAGAARGLSVTTRSGGHSYIAGGLGGKDGALVVDMSNFKAVVVNEADSTAEVGAGVLLGDLALALNAYGRALPHGRCPTVGAGGHTTGGGYGHTSRMWGLLLDHLVSATVILGNGTIVETSKSQNADLFWSIRGAGASFGVVTSFIFATEPVPSLGGTAFRYGWNLTATEANDALQAFQTFVQGDIPLTFGAQLNFNQSTALGYVNMEYFGELWGDSAELDEINGRFLDQLNAPDSTEIFSGDWITVLNASAWGDLNTSATDPQHITFYIKSLMVPEPDGFSPSAIEAFIAYLTSEMSVTLDLSWFVEIELYGGTNSAINAVPANETAFAHRNKMFTLQMTALSPDFQPPFPEEGFAFIDGMADSIIQNEPKDWPYGAYVNYPDPRLQQWKKLYYGDHYEELSYFKDIYDPGNVFSFPQAIEPKS